MIDLRGVTRRFGNVTAVDHVDLSIKPGEFLTLLGPSGCGKTTLLRMISGFDSPDEGTVWLDGKDVTRLPPYRRDVNQVFQSYALFPHLTVGENIAFGLRMKRVPRSEIDTRVVAAAKLVSLGELLARRPSQLSGGQRQRVALARAIVCEPRVLLLDEPLSALDAKLRHSMQFELKRLQQSLGITFVFVTHDQAEALTMSDRIAVVRAGKIEQLGAAAEIYRRPATAFVADFLGQANVLRGTVTSRAGSQLRVRVGEIELEAADNGGTGFAANGVSELLAATTSPDAAAILVSIRPEKIELADVGPVANVFPGRVAERLFRGPVSELRIDTTAGRVTVTTTDTARAIGDAVVCRVRAEDVVVVRG